MPSVWGWHGSVHCKPSLFLSPARLYQDVTVLYQNSHCYLQKRIRAHGLGQHHQRGIDGQWGCGGAPAPLRGAMSFDVNGCSGHFHFLAAFFLSIWEVLTPGPPVLICAFFSCWGTLRLMEGSPQFDENNFLSRIWAKSEFSNRQKQVSQEAAAETLLASTSLMISFSPLSEPCDLNTK